MKINVIMEEVRTKNISADGINENADLYLLDVNVLKNFSNDIPVTDNEDRVIGKVDKCKLEEILSTRPVEMIPKILDCITAGIVAIDTSGTIFYANQEYSNLIGKSLKDILGRNVDEFTAHSAIITVARTGQRIIMDKRFLEAVNKNVSGVVYPIYVKSKLRGAVSIFTDTTVEELKNRVEEACSEVVFLRQRIQEEQKEKLNGVSSDSLIIGQSYAHLDLMERATIVAETDLPVLIKGENGVGKEVVARYIHKKSFRSNKPFIVVNCAAIPDNLVESELFGYEAGSFTGAKTNGKAGKFELANGGTLFLDEIGDMPLTMQTKLLRSLEYQEIEKIGSEKMVSVDVRIISATNQDLEKMIGNKTFRKDLFYRINTISLIVPPLRNRREDVGLFINYFLRMMNSKYNKEVRLSDDAFSLLHNHNWPGNVRELRNFIESAVVMNNNNLIDNKTLYDYFGEQINSSAKNMAALSKNETFIPIKLEEAMDDTEKNLLIMTLKACNNNKTEAMEILGVSRRTFYRKLSKHDLI